MEPFLGLGLTTWLIGAIIVIVIYYWYKSSVNHYWKSKNVPSDSPTHSLGRLLDALITGKTLFALDDAQVRKHGRICGFYFGRTPMLLLSEPEHIRMIFVKDFHNFPERRTIATSNNVLSKMLSNLRGEEWKRMRTIISPVFTSGKMRKLALLINRSAEILTECFLESADSKKAVDLKRLFGGFTLDVIASTAFGTELDSIRNPDNIFGTNARKLFNFSLNWRFVVFAFAPKLMIKLGIGLFPPNIMTFFSDLVLKIREQRVKGGEFREDFLQMLIDIESTTRPTEEKEDGRENHFATEGGDQLPLEHHFKKTLTRDELLAQCVLFFAAGYDTTGTTLTLVAYLLALNPKCQDRLLEEVDHTWEKNEGKVDFDIVSTMKYLEAVVAETLRLYPPATRIERKCVEDYVLGETGITIPKDMFIGVPVYTMHRNPDFFPDPEKFDPERFLPENKDSIIPYTYLPFGSGPRNCIAMRFALMEMKLCLVHVLRHVSFHRCPETKVPLEFYNGLGLIRPKGAIVGAERRR